MRLFGMLVTLIQILPAVLRLAIILAEAVRNLPKPQRKDHVDLLSFAFHEAKIDGDLKALGDRLAAWRGMCKPRGPV
jgi:hypothetical protein